MQANVQLKDVPEAKMVLEKYNLMTLGKMLGPTSPRLWAEKPRNLLISETDGF